MLKSNGIEIRAIKATEFLCFVIKECGCPLCRKPSRPWSALNNPLNCGVCFLWTVSYNICGVIFPVARRPMRYQFGSGAGGHGFKSWAGQIKHRATVATSLRKELCCPSSVSRQRAPQTCYTLGRNTASIIKVCFCFLK